MCCFPNWSMLLRILVPSFQDTVTFYMRLICTSALHQVSSSVRLVYTHACMLYAHELPYNSSLAIRSMLFPLNFSPSFAILLNRKTLAE